MWHLRSLCLVWAHSLALFHFLVTSRQDLTDRDLTETACREWDEEVLGFPFSTVQHKHPVEHVHPVRKLESVKFPVDTHVFVRVNDAFFEATSEGHCAAAKFPHIATLDHPIYFKSDGQPSPSDDQIRAYHAGVGTSVEHEWFTWMPIGSGGALSFVDRSAQLPIRREDHSPQYREGLCAFLALVSGGGVGDGGAGASDELGGQRRR